MKDHYTLRPSNAEDAQIIVGWFRTHEDAVSWGGAEVANPLTADWLAHQFLDHQRRYYVLTDETARTLGTYFLYHMPEHHRLHLGRFAIAPNYRGRGLGSFMLQYAIDAGRSYGVKKLTLNVFEHNEPAQRLYNRWGFYVAAGEHLEHNPRGTAIPMILDL